MNKRKKILSYNIGCVKGMAEELNGWCDCKPLRCYISQVPVSLILSM